MSETEGKRGAPWLLAIPPLAFAAFALFFWLGLARENPDELPSALAGNAAPVLDLPPLDGSGSPAPGDAVPDGIHLVNFWASWCGPCRAEHPTLEAAAAAGVPIIGVNYKDEARNARAFLEELGNPYIAIGTDESGRTGFDWGLYGVPETFVIDGDGQVLMRFPGPVTRRVWEDRFAEITGTTLE